MYTIGLYRRNRHPSRPSFSYFNNNANVGSKLALGIPANSDSTFAGNSASPFARSGISATQAASEIIGNFTSTAHRDLMIWSANEAAKGNCELMKRIALFNNGTIVYQEKPLLAVVRISILGILVSGVALIVILVILGMIVPRGAAIQQTQVVLVTAQHVVVLPLVLHVIPDIH